MSLFDQVPGYRAAVDRERTNRDLAFCGLPVPLCGVAAVQMSPRIYLRLLHCDNAFVVGREPTSEDVAIFLWFVSPDYSLNQKARDKWIKRHVRKLPYRSSVIEINAYLNRTFMDAAEGRSSDKSYVSSLSNIVDLIASEYGGPSSWILEEPLACIFQYVRSIRARRDPKSPQFNPSEKLVSKWLRDRNASDGQS